jgi:hypothetical protein
VRERAAGAVAAQDRLGAVHVHPARPQRLPHPLPAHEHMCAKPLITPAETVRIAALSESSPLIRFWGPGPAGPLTPFFFSPSPAICPVSFRLAVLSPRPAGLVFSSFDHQSSIDSSSIRHLDPPAEEPIDYMSRPPEAPSLARQSPSSAHTSSLSRRQRALPSSTGGF